MTENKKTRSTRYFLEDIIECIHKVQKYASKGKDSFFEDEILQDALIRRLEIIGEASNRLPKEILQHYPEIPWRQIIGFRNIAIHEYFQVDLHLIWSLVESDELDKLLSVATKILSELTDLSP
jgi:uncharacterized protein with HEPN domain